VVNARDAMPADRAGLIRIRTAPGDPSDLPDVEGAGGAAARCVSITVADDGVGMTDEVRRQILEPFFTTKGDAGTGLGLAQVDMFMREIGGALHIDSRSGAGTEIRLLLPVDGPSASEVAGVQPPEDG